jgi:hypothetical protein
VNTTAARAAWMKVTRIVAAKEVLRKAPGAMLLSLTIANRPMDKRLIATGRCRRWV